MAKYRQIRGCPGYRVGDDGTVWTKWEKIGLGYGKGSIQRIGKTWKEMKSSPNSKGYLVIGLRTAAGKRKTHYVHDLVLTAFVGSRPPGQQACHDPDRTKTNCRRDNLRWGTSADNHQDSVRHGTHVKGEDVGTSVLTEKKVRRILRRFAEGEPKARIASDMGIAWSTVDRVVRNENWCHIPR